VYHAAKVLLPRCVKWIPHPDSLGFHQRPLRAPGRFAPTLDAGGRQTCPWAARDGTVAAHAELLVATAWLLVEAVPTQNVDPATLPAATLFSTLTACPAAEVTLLTYDCSPEADAG